MDTQLEYGADDIPLPAYTVLIGTYATVFAGLFALETRKRPAALPLEGVDLATIVLGSYKFSRIITMSFIASPIRAPFTRRGESLKGGEVQDESSGAGMQKAVGNLLTCPFCFNIWSTTFFVFGHALAPRLTMRVAKIFAIAAVGDLLHFGYRNLREKSE